MSHIFEIRFVDLIRTICTSLESSQLQPHEIYHSTLKGDITQCQENIFGNPVCKVLKGIGLPHIIERGLCHF